ncbi:hypothetical protein HISP_17635 (plasmid) [Haloarcula hispanica N601]|uniref:Uncharacterized protein n=1 Tax=Haloarcula hispanica N601 TaxID=1417673 RepID=V5TS56_HALHI|nr:hypothetical protein HISP_17635 [Haloarcula hispanica N601]KAA9400991.1 hypothetical protein Har1131_20400 [Haloarcula sp. CBA1131]
MTDSFDKLGGEYLRIKLALVVWAFVTVAATLIVEMFIKNVFDLVLSLIVGIIFAFVTYRGI